MGRLLLLLILLVLASDTLAADPQTPPATQPFVPLQPYTAFSIAFPGPTPQVKVMYPLYIATNPGIAAKEISRMREGARVVMANDAATGILDHPDDVCIAADGTRTEIPGIWPTHGPDIAAKRLDAWLTRFAQAGGTIDLLVLGFEESLAIWNMPENRLAAITADKRFAALKKQLGIEDARQAMPHRATKAAEHLRWNAVMSGIVSDAVRRAVAEPLHKHFPKAAICNFNDLRLSEEHAAVDVSGWPVFTVDGPAGTHQSPVYFGGASLRAIPVDWRRPYVQLIYATNFARCLSRSSAVPQLPWVPFKGLMPAGGRQAGFGGGDMYEEMVFHVLLSGGTDNLIFYNPLPPADLPPGAKAAGVPTPADAAALNTLLADMPTANAS